MATLNILVYPDPVLKMVSAKVDEITAELSEFIQDLLETMLASPGCVGIAAPQVGCLKRIIAIDASRSPKCTDSRGQMLLINPVIESEEGRVTGREGCLSLPDFTANVARAEKITVSAFNEDWQQVRFESFGFEARVILHEYDHLDGLLFLDRVSSLKTDVFRRKKYQ